MASKPPRRRQKAPPVRPEGPAVLGYVRVSTEEQAKSGLGLEDQRLRIAEGAARLNLPLLNTWADEGVGGATPFSQRPALAAALGELRSRDVLMVSKRDRLARSVTELAFIEREVELRGARIASAAGEGTGDDPADQLMRRMLDAFAEFERELISARTKAALQAKKRKGGRVGNVEFGKRVLEGRLVEAEEEIAIIRAVAEELAAGGSQRGIVMRLWQRKLVSPRSGKPLGLRQVQRLIKRLRRGPLP